MNDLDKFTVEGIDQWVLFRGNINKPILLILQQGPGMPLISEANDFEKILKLEKDFIIAYWDQRSCGKSFSKTISHLSMNLEQLINDTHKLTQEIKKKMSVAKIFIMGFSIGGSIALLTADKYPEDYYACVSVGMDIKIDEGDKIAYEFILDQALKLNNKKALKEIKKIGNPPHIESKKFLTRVKWVTNFGGVNRKETYMSILYKTIRNLFFSKEYSFKDILKTVKGMNFAQSLLLKDMHSLNMFERVKKLKIAVYFFQGKYDYAAPSILVERYFNYLTPNDKKQLIWFDNSSHSPYYEEPDRFRKLLIKKILKETYTNKI